MQPLDHPDDPLLDMLPDVPQGTKQIAMVWLDKDGRLHARWVGMKASDVVTTLYEAADEICRQKIPLTVSGTDTRQ